MTAATLRSLALSAVQHLPALQQALWHDAQGDWHAAHLLAQDVDTPEGAWVHAYLHRREGDDANAAYWYRRAGKPVSRGDLDAEWANLVEGLFADTPHQR